MWTRTPNQRCLRAETTGDCPYSHAWQAPDPAINSGRQAYGRTDHKTDLRVANPAQASYVDGLIAGVTANASDGGTRAQVAALAVRRIVSYGGTEWGIVVDRFGEPSHSDWVKAQAAYGPNRKLPGWTYIPAFALPAEGFTIAELDDRLAADRDELTEAEARALDGNR